MLNVVPKQYGNSLNEINQQVKIQFAFLSEDNVQCHDLVLCRDYLHDVVYSMHGDKEVNVYGFIYTKDNPRIDLNNIKLLVRMDSNLIKETAESALSLINHYEELGNFKVKTTLSSVLVNKEVKEDLRVFVGSKEWLTSPALISLYTFLIRLGAKKIKFKNNVELVQAYAAIMKKEESDNDKAYLKSIHEYIAPVVMYRDKIFKTDKDIFVEYKNYKNLSTGSIHNYRGIVTLCTNGYDGGTLNMNVGKALEMYNSTIKPEETKKKEKTSIIINVSDSVSLQMGTLSFGLVGKPPERNLCTCLFSCRDYFNDYLSFVYNQEKADTRISAGVKPIKEIADLDKLRLLVGAPPIAKEKIFFAKKLLNIIEKTIGFKTTSRISSVATSKTSKDSFFLITGPKEWLSYAPALSFLTFIFKSCYFIDVTVMQNHSKVKTIEEIKSFFKAGQEYARSHNSNCSYNNGYLTTYLNNMDYFINGFNEIFIEEDNLYKFPPKTINVHGGWGILSLFENNGAIKNVSARFNQYKKTINKVNKELI